MKNSLLIALALSLSTMTAFAGTKVNNKEARKAAVETCKSEGKSKTDLKTCVKEKLVHAAPQATK